MVGWASWAPGKVVPLDLDTRTWETRNAEGGTELAPTSSGLFGRWRYVPSLNASIAVSDANGNVFFYKYSAGMGQPRKPE